MTSSVSANAPWTLLPNYQRTQDEQAGLLFGRSEGGSAMRKSRMQKLAIGCIAAFAVLGGIGATNAQMHGGGGGFLGPEYYPYGYSCPYGDVPLTFYGNPDAADVEPQDSGSNYWYCRDPAGYYPDVQTCPSGWLQVVPNN